MRVRSRKKVQPTAQEAAEKLRFLGGAALQRCDNRFRMKKGL
jgi:hypothetical protein